MNTITTLPNVSKYFDNDSYLKESYEDRAFSIINRLYDDLMNNRAFCGWAACESNSYMDLYIEFSSIVDGLTAQYLLDDKLSGLEMYNFMNEKPFYHIWLTDLLDYMIEVIRNNK